MSQTMSVGVVDAGYWSYMATVMADGLNEMIKKRGITADSIPGGVYNGARKFFDLVMQTADNAHSLPENPQASINAYVIATRAIRAVSSGSDPMPRQQVIESLQQYSSFVANRLSVPGELAEEDVETAQSLRNFFQALAKNGKDEEYSKLVWRPSLLPV